MFEYATEVDVIQGAKFWWDEAPSQPCVLTVIAIGDMQYYFSVDMYVRSGMFSYPKEVMWSLEELHAALSNKSLVKWKAPIRREDLQGHEVLCFVCNGSCWEQARDLEMTPCITCGFTGKRNRPAGTSPHPVQRSPFHPRIT